MDYPFTSFLQSNFQEQSRSQSWLADIKQQAFDAFMNEGFPSRKTEQWKYTRLNELLSQTYEDSSVKDNSIIEIQSPEQNGYRVYSLAEACEMLSEELQQLLLKQLNSLESAAFQKINLAFLNDCRVIHVEKNTHLEMPIEISVSAQSGGCHHTCLVYLVDEGAVANFVEHYQSDGSDYFNNHVSHIVVQGNAHCQVVKVINEAPTGHHIAHTYIEQQAHSHVHHSQYAFNGKMIRSDITANLNSSGADNKLTGLYVAGEGQHIAHYTKVNHLVPHTTSDEQYKGVLFEDGHAVFNGGVYVAPNAQKTSASQQNNNLLLSSRAEIDTKPQLEIYADDVKCAHGATVGQLDEQMLFYLQSRGLSQPAAIQLLIDAFASDLVNQLPAAYTSTQKTVLALMSKSLNKVTGEQHV